MTGTLNHLHIFITTRTGAQSKRRCTQCDVTWRWDPARASWVENTTPAKVWMLVQQWDSMSWLPVSVHATRESALAAVPTDAVHEPGDPDPDMCEPEEWAVPWKPTGRLAGARLRIQEWEVTA